MSRFFQLHRLRKNAILALKKACLHRSIYTQTHTGLLRPLSAPSHHDHHLQRRLKSDSSGGGGSGPTEYRRLKAESNCPRCSKSMDLVASPHPQSLINLCPNCKTYYLFKPSKLSPSRGTFVEIGRKDNPGFWEALKSGEPPKDWPMVPAVPGQNSNGLTVKLEDGMVGMVGNEVGWNRSGVICSNKRSGVNFGGRLSIGFYRWGNLGESGVFVPQLHQQTNNTSNFTPVPIIPMNNTKS